MRHIDLLVAGAGPAGAALATLAARAGLRVVAVDRDRFPRDKVCGEFLSAEGCAALERLGVLDEVRGDGTPWMDRCRLSDGDGRVLDLPLPALAGGGRAALGVSRRRLDRLLVETAAGAGVEVRTGCAVTDVLLEDGRARGLRVRGRGRCAEESLRATVVVAADGRRSAVGRRLTPASGDPTRTRHDSWFGLKTHLADPASAGAARVELHLFEGGYAGVAPVEEGRLNLCLLTRVDALRACGGRPDRLLAERLLGNPALRDRLGRSPVAGPWKTVGPLRFNTRRTSADGALFVGDAAGTVDPFCGEGMSNALCGAELLLPHVLAAATAGAVDTGIAAAYRQDWRRLFSAAAARGRLLGALLQRPALASPLLSLLRGPARALGPRLVAATRTGATRG